MQTLVALLVSIVAAASGPLTEQTIQANVLPESGEVYVAELDADWNVAREVRLPCVAELGCTVELGLTEAGLGRLHVRFDSMRSGKIAVNSVIEDNSGNAASQPVVTLVLDRTGFGAGHYEAGSIKTAVLDGSGTRIGADGKPIILMAIKVPGWAAPAGSLALGGRT